MSGPVPFFASDRERRLWQCALAAAVAIYATLGLGSSLAGVLYHQAWGALAFLGGMLLIGLSILTQGLRVRLGGREIGVAIGIAVVYLFLFFRMTIPERSHLIEYSVVAVFIREALVERALRGRGVPLPAPLAVLAASLLGALDEGIQWLLPGRVFDVADILFNTMAAVLAVLAMAVLGWARRGGRREP